MTGEQLALVYKALRRNDGESICPDWPREDQKALTLALDALRVEMLELIEKGTK